MAQFLTTAELRDAPASTAAARMFKYTVIHQTPNVDAILKRHASITISGYLKAARLQRNKPLRDTALVDFICELLVRATGENGEDEARKYLMLMFGATTTDKLQLNRLCAICRPELKPHHNYQMTWRRIADREEEALVDLLEHKPAKRRQPPREKQYKTAEEWEAAMIRGDVERKR